MSIINDNLVIGNTSNTKSLTVTGALGVTGATTFTGTTTFNGAITLGDAAGDVLTLTGTVTGDTLIGTTSKLTFYDTGLYIHASANGKLKIASDGTGADDITLSGTVTVDDDITMGSTKNINTTSTGKIQLGDTGTYINQSANGKILISSDGTGTDDITLSGTVTTDDDIIVGDGKDILFGTTGQAQFHDTGLYIGASADAKLVISSDGTTNDAVTINGPLTITSATLQSQVLLTPQAQPTASPAEGMLYADTDHKLYYYDGSSWDDLTAGTGAVSSLDDAYDDGGSAAGREVAVDQGAVLLTGTHVSNNVLDVNGAGSGDSLQVANTSTGFCLDVNQTGTASAIDINCDASVTGHGVAVTNTGSGSDFYGTSGLFAVAKTGDVTALSIANAATGITLGHATGTSTILGSTLAITPATTITGAIIGSSTILSTGNFTVGSSKLVTTASTGSTAIASTGTLTVNTIAGVSAATMAIGGATSTALNLGASGIVVTSLGQFDVKDSIDKTAAGALKIGDVTATSVEISLSGAETDIQGTLSVDEAAVFDTTVTSTGNFTVGASKLVVTAATGATVIATGAGLTVDSVQATGTTTLSLGTGGTTTAVDIGTTTETTTIKGLLNVDEAATFDAAVDITSSNAANATALEVNQDDTSTAIAIDVTNDGTGADLKLTNLNDNATGVVIYAHHDVGAAADNGDAVFTINMMGDDSGTGLTEYARIEGEIQNVTAGQEDGRLVLSVAADNSALTQMMALQPRAGGAIAEIAVGASGANAFITTVGTSDLTLDTNSSTNSGSIVIADGAAGDITIAPNGAGATIIDNIVPSGATIAIADADDPYTIPTDVSIVVGTTDGVGALNATLPEATGSGRTLTFYFAVDNAQNFIVSRATDDTINAGSDTANTTLTFNDAGDSAVLVDVATDTWAVVANDGGTLA